ncbi:methylated-DNA--[protein]-cysteine S-methyltransferase [Bacillus benzoevorans]|uniref:Methylated-DNA--protein-cysteine methyltransferase n=1 Tax=Bacillus benzoevorans TaxID=1456 RepID=A0A7X0HQA2_9BACI|nr:methylated-DNA--[protein]-cysteine S-methyltransferase [Bacillus benzoevorans]MBB6444967.1 methylated-DNA-[protein]-cysteine S-methyltransferase [Bacillus benzoevorans]
MKSDHKITIYWSLLIHHPWRMHVAATEKGMCFVGSLNEPFEEVVQWAEKNYPGSPLIEDAELLQPYVEQLTEYLEGKRTHFTIPTDFKGTEFQVAVWEALCRIPYGETRSYSDIARHIKRHAAVRAVGAAIGKNPVMIIVPCHRVIGKNGSLTGFRGGLDMKKQLLELESRPLNDKEE